MGVNGPFIVASQKFSRGDAVNTALWRLNGSCNFSVVVESMSSLTRQSELNHSSAF